MLYRRPKRTIILQFFLFILLTIFMVGCSSASSGKESTDTPEKVYKWRMVTHQMPGTSRYDNTIAPFVEDIKKASGGRLIIEPYGANNLFPTDETFDSIKNGVVEMGAVYSGLWTGKDPVFGLAGGIAGDPIEGFSEHFYRSEELEPILSEAYEKHGIKNLGSFDFAPSEILISTVPIKTIEDFKGKNIRAAGVANLYYGKLGASSVSLSAPEIYTALQLGTVDAAEYNDYLVNQEMGLEEVTKYIIDPAMHVGPLSDKELIVNPEAWEELPNDLKEIVIAARDKIRYRSAVAYTVENFKAKDDWIANGVEIIELPKEDVDKMRDIAFDLLLELREKSPTSEEYVDKYAEVLFELGYDDEAKKLGYKN